MSYMAAVSIEKSSSHFRFSIFDFQLHKSAYPNMLRRASQLLPVQNGMYMGPWAWGIFTSTLIASWETNAGLYTRAVGCRHHCRRRTAATMLPPSHCHRRSVTACAAARQPPQDSRRPHHHRPGGKRARACSAARLKAEMNDSSFKGNPFSAQATQCKPSYSCRIYPVDPPPLRICLPSSPIHSDLFFENSKASFLKVWSLEFTFKPPKCQK